MAGRARASSRVGAGFTLLELVVVLFLMGLLVASASSFVWNLLDRRASLVRMSRDLRVGNALIELVEDQLLTSVVLDARGGGGISGDGARLSVFSRGLWMTADGYAASAGQMTTVAFDEDRGVLSLRRVDGGGDTRAEEIGDQVARLRFRYHDGDGWRAQFDSGRAGRFPGAVEVALWFGPTSAVASSGSDDSPFNTDEEALLSEAAAFDETDFGEERVWGEPDRLRVIAIPDGVVPAPDGGSG